MLQTIRPSEMCGVSQAYQQAERVQVRRASAVRISMSGMPSRPSSEYHPKPQLQHKTSYNVEILSRTPEDAPPMPYSELSATSRPYSSIPAAAQTMPARAVPRRKREGVLGFLTRKDSTASSSTQCSRDQDERDKRPDYRSSMSNERVPQEPRYRREEYSRQHTAPARRRPQHRPTMSLFVDGPHEPRMTVGTLSSRPISIAVQRPLVSKWTPSSSSSEVSLGALNDSPPSSVRQRTATFLDGHTSDDDSNAADLSFLNDFKRSPIAAYLAGAEELPEQSTPTAPTFPRTDPVQAGKGTFWLTDTDSDAARDDGPDLSFWDGTKTARTTVIARPTESSDDDNWPLPNAQSDVFVPYASQVPDLEPTRTISHTSNLSRGTISSISTLRSPTFSHGRTESTAASAVSQVPFSNHLNPADPTLDDAASIAPSEISLQWTQSPKERLGLGGIVRKTEALPWEEKTQHPRRLQKSADLTRTRSVSDRFSAFMSWRDRN